MSGVLFQYPRDIPYPDINMSEEQQENVTRNTFGDGYEQRVLNNAANSRKTVLELTWTLDFDEGLSFYAWLLQVKNITAFVWAAPDTEEKKWLCTKAKRTHKKNTFTVTATFEEVFDLNGYLEKGALL